MSETRGPDPLRRSPPTIDLKADEVLGPDTKPSASAGSGKDAAVAKGDSGKGSAEAGGPTGPGKTATETGKTAVEPVKTAIEPVAATGLDPLPKTGDGKGAIGASKAPASAEAGRGATGPKAGASPAGAGAKPSAPAGDPKSSSGKPTGPEAKPAATAVTTPNRSAMPGVGGGPARAEAPKSEPAKPGAGKIETTKAESAKPATATGTGRDAAAQEAPPAARAGFGRLLGAGLVGGIVGAGLATGASHLYPAATDGGAADRLTALERRVAALPAASATPSVEPRIAALEAGLKQAADDARAARTGADAAAKQAAELAGRPTAPGVDPALAGRIEALATRLDESGKQTSAAAAAIAALGVRIDETAKRSGETGTAVAALGTRMQEGLAAGTAAVGAIGASLRGVETDLATLKTGQAGMEARSGEAERRVADLSGTVTGLSAEVGTLSPAAIQAGLRVVVAGRLDDALRSGAPLGPVLAALTKLGIEPAALAPLQPFADAPPPSAAALAAEFKPLAATLTAVPAAPDEGFLDRARRLAGKVVTVRAVGDGSGQDLPGIVARIESALVRGALAEAATAWESLPAPAKATSDAWASRLKARVGAEAAARRVGTQSLSALDAATR